MSAVKFANYFVTINLCAKSGQGRNILVICACILNLRMQRPCKIAESIPQQKKTMISVRNCKMQEIKEAKYESADNMQNCYFLTQGLTHFNLLNEVCRLLACFKISCFC